MCRVRVPLHRYLGGLVARQCWRATWYGSRTWSSRKEKKSRGRAVVGCQSRMMVTACGLAAGGAYLWAKWGQTVEPVPASCFPFPPSLSPPSLPICCRLFLLASICLFAGSQAPQARARHPGKCLRVTSRSTASCLLTGWPAAWLLPPRAAIVIDTPSLTLQLVTSSFQYTRP